ncbi:MAG: hypothetical protein WCV93_04785 [Candidatus Shapirobacteria bacterium]|jgi:hypothetical protein
MKKLSQGERIALSLSAVALVVAEALITNPRVNIQAGEGSVYTAVGADVPFIRGTRIDGVAGAELPRDGAGARVALYGAITKNGEPKVEKLIAIEDVDGIPEITFGFPNEE